MTPIISSIIPIILAGGIGQRLWPLSTPENPKQFIPFISQQSLYQNTLTRLAPLGTAPSAVVTSIQHQELATMQAGPHAVMVLPEPCGRNTAAAIAYAALTYQQQADAVLVITPADHFVQDQTAFETTINHAVATAATPGRVVLIGAPPTYPATGFGYIQTITEPGQHALRVCAFHEKPNKAHAQTFFDAQTYWWNTGMVIARVDTLLAQFALYAPDILHDVQAFIEGKKSYAAVRNIPFDYAVLEQSSNCWMIPATFVWHDVGTLETFVRLSQIHNDCKPNLIQLQGTNNLATGTDKKLVVCVGLSNVTIVQTNDILLVMDQGAGQEIRNAAQCVQTVLTKGATCNP